MSVTLDIVAMYRRPRAVVSRQMQTSDREPQSLVYLVLACVLVFVGQWPNLARQAHVDPSVPLEARLGGALMAWVIMMPLIFYAIAFVVQISLRLLRARIPGHAVRRALFWGLLSAAPLWMLYGLAQGMLGPVEPTAVLGFLVLAVTMWFWVQGMRAAHASCAIAPDDKLA